MTLVGWETGVCLKGETRHALLPYGCLHSRQYNDKELETYILQKFFNLCSGSLFPGQELSLSSTSVCFCCVIPALPWKPDSTGKFRRLHVYDNPGQRHRPRKQPGGERPLTSSRLQPNLPVDTLATAPQGSASSSILSQKRV